LEIISHRGLWNMPQEKNSENSFINSFKLMYGTETDVRDFNGGLVISHDIANESCMEINSFFDLYNKHTGKVLALNIKSDGLASLLSKTLNKHEIENYFVFDMSIPDTIGYLKLGMKVFIRQSEYERELPFYEECTGVWLDSFLSVWYDLQVIEHHLKNGKKVCIVSPELHNRDYINLWEILKTSGLQKVDGLILCTDKPVEATNFFNI
jgi:hypothetical protein